MTAISYREVEDLLREHQEHPDIVTDEVVRKKLAEFEVINKPIREKQLKEEAAQRKKEDEEEYKFYKPKIEALQAQLPIFLSDLAAATPSETIKPATPNVPSDEELAKWDFMTHKNRLIHTVYRQYYSLLLHKFPEHHLLLSLKGEDDASIIFILPPEIREIRASNVMFNMGMALQEDDKDSCIHYFRPRHANQ